MKTKFHRLRKALLVGSVVLNILVALPALIIFGLNDGIRFYLYEQFAERTGDTRIVFIGDSITRDGGIWGVRIEKPWFEVRNLAHSGLYTEQMIYQAQIGASQHAKIAFVMAGINDVRKPSFGGAPESFEAYVRILDELRSRGVEPVIQSTLYREDGTDAEFVSELNNLLRAYAAEHEIAYLDLNRELCEGGNLKSEFSRDGTHLTEKAYRVWSEKIREFLESNGDG